MDIKRYVAMTKAELATFPVSEDLPAWMSCHFSPYGIGLTNLPDWLPQGSMIILNDITPPHGHDADVIAMQLNALAQKSKTDAFLLDFQRVNNRDTAKIVTSLSKKLVGKVAVTEAYAHCTNGAIFLTCPLPHRPLKYSISKWSGRELWLELATDTEIITITNHKAIIEYSSQPLLSDTDLYDSKLKCRYRKEITDSHAKIILERTPEMLLELQAEAASLGIHITVGLYQQLYEK